MYKHVLVCMKNYNIQMHIELYIYRRSVILSRPNYHCGVKRCLYNIQMHIERFSNIFFNECNILVYLKNKFTSSYLNVAKIYHD